MPPAIAHLRDPSVLPGLHECLTTSEGLRRKVVTTQRGLRCPEAVDGDRLVGDELPLFQELFVLDARPSAAGWTHFLVSRSPRGHTNSVTWGPRAWPSGTRDWGCGRSHPCCSTRNRNRPRSWPKPARPAAGPSAVP